MPDYHEEEFSPEELEALGEGTTEEKTAEETEEGTGTQEETTTEEGEATTETEQGEASAEQTEETQAEDKDPIQKRFDRLTWEKHETERKLDLFKKLGPEGYYQAYPDERPAEQEKPQPQQQVQQPVQQDIGSMIVRQPGGPYDGMTLRDVYAEDPVFATQLQTNFYRQQWEAEAARNAQQSQLKNAATQEIETFADSIAQETFGKPSKELSKDEESRIHGTIQEVIAWMTTTHRGGGNISDAYFLMNREGLLKKAKESASQKAIKDLQERKGPPSIDTGRGNAPQDTGFEAYGKMTEEQLEAKIGKMSDRELDKFLKEAPQSLRSKFSSLPWG